MASGRKTGQIVNRGDDRWLVRVYAGEDGNGKRRYHSKVIRGRKKDAQKELQDLLRKNDLGLFGDARNQTLGEFMVMWLESVARPRLSRRTHKDYEDLWRRYIKEPLGSIKLQDLKAVHIQKIYGDMSSRGLSPRVVRYTHSTLSSALNKAVELDIISRNVAKFVQLPRQIRTEMKVLSATESRHFLATAKNERLGPVFSFALATGMRMQEYCAIQWKDIDFDKGTATVQRALVWNRSGGGWQFSHPKTAKSRRTIPIPSSIVAELKKHPVEQLEEKMRLGKAWTDFDLVFPSQVGTPIMPRNLMKVFKRILKEAKMSTDLRLYDLRHTTATLLLEAGINPKVVSERLGHSTITLTLDVYSHVLPHMQEQASNELEAMIFGTSGR